MFNATARKPAGNVLITEPGMPAKEFDTLQCVHCGGQWQVVPGSGILRGFCTRCHGPFCGPQCSKCIPHEKWLEQMERLGVKRP